jgi:ferredoxin
VTKTEGPGACAQPILVADRCTGCGLCVEACPCGAVHLGADRRPVFACAASCTGAAQCVAHQVDLAPCQEVCDAGAIEWAFAIRREPEKG